jgi:monoamine oxidase
MAGAALTLGARLPLAGCDGDGSTSKDVTIGIVGAGMAGLMCARTLEKAGLRATLFEGQNRVGGRMWTAREGFSDGQLIELGGELIDTEHGLLRALAVELGLTLDDFLEVDKDVDADRLYFDGDVLDDAALLTAWGPLAQKIRADALASESSDAELARLDALSIADYLDAVNGLDPMLRKVLDLAYVGEYGLEVDQQSALNLIWMAAEGETDAFSIYGTSDERFHTHLGNDSFPTAVAAALSSTIELGHRLVAVKTLSDGRHRLTFDRGGTSVEAVFDHVVFTLPWTTLRAVTFDPPLPADKASMIAELGYGTNAKLMLQFNSRVWRTQHGSSGSTFCNNGPQTLWETSRGQAGQSGILTVFTGGAEGLAVGNGTAEARAQAYLGPIDAIYPGTKAAYRTDSAVRMHWPSFEWMKGSYACYLPGQAAWNGTEGEPVGTLHFAGEHTSADFQGYMEGAAESGIRAANEILDIL